MRLIAPMRRAIAWLGLTGTSIGEFTRFGLVGLATNGAGYFIYLVLTGAGVAPLAAVPITYAYCILQSFFLNRTWSYRDDSPPGPTIIRYCVVYVLCYVSNSLVLLTFVDVFHFDHKIVQAVCIVLAGIALYFVQKLWVFAKVPLRYRSGKST